MSLDVLLEPIPAKAATPCKVAQLITSLDEPYKSAVQNLVDTSYKQGGLSDYQLRERLLSAGIDVGGTVINYHRRGVCSCRKLLVG